MIIFAFISLLFLIPFLLVLSISFSSETDVIQKGYSLLPRNFTLNAYRYIFENLEEIVTGYKITIFVTVIGTILSVFIMAMCSYCLVRSNCKFRRPLMFFIFFTMLFSGGLVPNYILVTQYLHLNDTVWIMVINGLVNAFHIVLLRTYFQSVPEGLFEAAKIDGAGEFTIFLRILLPMSKPAIATVALMGALARWNDWYTAMLYVTKEELTPLSYVLYKVMADLQFMASNMQSLPESFTNSVTLPAETARMAMCIVAAGPMLFIFPFFQKYFVKGLTVGSIKG